MIEPKRSCFSLLTWFYLLFLLLPAVYLLADAHSPTEPTQPPSAPLRNDVDLPASVKAVILLCAFILISIFSIYLNHWAVLYIAHRHEIGGGGRDWRCSCSTGIGREVIDTFPILLYSTIKDLKIGKGALECAVCLSEFEDYETLRLVPKCNHVFHPECIDAWLASHVTCPVCRSNLNPDSGEASIGVPTQLNANELDEESEENSGGSRAEASESEQQQHAVLRMLNEGESTSSNCCQSDTDRANMCEGRATQNGNRRSRRRTFGKLPRSNSTGHSLVEPGKNTERHTLRLPEDIRRYILLNHAMIRRSASHNVAMPMKGMGWSDSEGSSRGKTNYIERQDQ